MVRKTLADIFINYQTADPKTICKKGIFDFVFVLVNENSSIKLRINEIMKLLDIIFSFLINSKKISSTIFLRKTF